jgi:methylated-DNA-[protein]-cysteine S-methyltransferase
MARARCTAYFQTAIGECAIAWNDVGLTAVWLPHQSREALGRCLRRHAPDALESLPRGAVAVVVDRVVRLLRGEHVDFDDAALDLEHTDDFDRRVYAVTRAIPAGRVLTYGEVAAQLGAKASARAVGQSLGRNPWPIVVPCHRVVAAGAALGGFSAPGGAVTKRRLLAIERARRAGAPDLFDAAPGDDALGTSGAESGSQAGARH